MRTQFTSTIWRITIYLLLFTLVIAPLAGSVRAAPESQETDPNVVAAPGDHLVTNIDLTPDTPNILRFNESVNITFDYSTTEPSGVRIFARPFTNGALTPNYAAAGSPIYPTSATGTGTS